MNTIIEIISEQLNKGEQKQFECLLASFDLNNPKESDIENVKTFARTFKNESLLKDFQHFCDKLDLLLYYKEEVFKYKDTFGIEHKVKVSFIPRTLKTLSTDFKETDILNFIIKQVIAHKCFSECRQAVKNGKPLQEWIFNLPKERKPMPKLPPELARKVAGLNPDKLEQLLNMLKD